MNIMSAKRLKISVIIPNYNHGYYLPEALDASLQQSRKPDEIIVVDDASTDNSEGVVKCYQQAHACIKFIKNERNQGATYTTNRGIEAAIGDLIVTRAADDLDYPGFYEQAAKLMETHSEAALCCGDIAFFGNDINIHQVESLGLADKVTYLSPDDLVERLGPDPVYGHTVMMRADLLKALGGYDSELKWYADWFCTLLLAFKYGICYVPSPFAYARLTEESYSSNNHGDEEANQRIYEAMLEKLKIEDKTVVSRFFKSGVFEFLGLGMQTTIKSDSSLAEFTTKTYYRPSVSKSKALENVIRRVLLEKKEAISKMMSSKGRFNVAIYGAGRHTRTLIPVWQELGLPPIHSVRVTGDVVEGQVFSRIPVCSINNLGDKDIDLVIISSKSFEKAMVNYCEDKLPEVKRLTFWDQTLTTL